MVKNTTIWTTLEPLIYQEEFMHLEEIARKLNKNHSSIRKYLNLFEKERILDRMSFLKTLKQNYPKIIT